MSTITNAGPTAEQLAHYGNLPLQAKSIRELEEFFQTAYNALYDLTFPIKTKRRAPFPIRHVGILAQVTEPSVHLNHFRFEKPNLNIPQLRLNLKVHQYRNSEPREDDSTCMRKWFPWLNQTNGGCGYANYRRGTGYEGVHQYNFPLHMFPELTKAVEDYHAQVLAAPYGEVVKKERRKTFPGFHYLCQHE